MTALDNGLEHGRYSARRVGTWRRRARGIPQAASGRTRAELTAPQCHQTDLDEPLRAWPSRRERRVADRSFDCAHKRAAGVHAAVKSATGWIMLPGRQSGPDKREIC